LVGSKSGFRIQLSRKLSGLLGQKGARPGFFMAKAPPKSEALFQKAAKDSKRIGIFYKGLLLKKC